jgi:hypothetical protein
MSGPLDQVPAVIERVRREIVLARFLGKLAVDQGIREARQRIDQVLTSVVPPPQPEPIDVDSVEVVPPQGAPPTEVNSGPTADSLALPGYDHLSAADIVAKLPGLEPDERAAIETYERAHRARRTVLGRLDQLKEHG